MDKKRNIYTPFILMGIIILLLVVTTFIKKIKGTIFVEKNIYDSIFFVLLWILLLLSGCKLLIKQKVYHRLSIFFLHMSFVIILIGAGTTWLCGNQGTLHLRQGEWSAFFINKEGMQVKLPFQTSLDNFQIIYNNKENNVPSDFVSRLKIKEGNKITIGTIAMNHIFSHKNYRFYQSEYDDDMKGSILAISYDPWGITISYAGYIMLFISILVILIQKKGTWQKLFNHPLLKKSVICLLLFSAAFSTYANKRPRSLPEELANEFGNLYVSYNNRICPFQTLAKDFTVKLYGKSRYKGLTCEQVLTGWMYFYSDWKDEPMIKIKNNDALRSIGIDKKYMKLSDLKKVYNQEDLKDSKKQIHKDKKDLEEVEDKLNLISILYSGQLLKIFPSRSTSESFTKWFSQGDLLPESMPENQWVFIKKFPDYLFEKIVQKDFKEASSLINKLKKYQIKIAGKNLPDNNHFKAEKLYNKIDYTFSIAIISIFTGTIIFIYLISCLIKKKQCKKWIKYSIKSLILFILIFMIINMSLRGYISGHVPLSSGYETMQFLAICIFSLTLFLEQKFRLTLSFGLLMGGLALLVSHFGQSNPLIIPLMPVLSSPLLSFHVVIIMIAYSLLSFIMLNGLTAVGLKYTQQDWQESVKKLYLISKILLFPAIFCLAIGIFIGAIWANISWGRYWGWDPKEVWALITLLVYSFAFHSRSLSFLHRPIFFHTFMIAAFICVLITYFGVNFILGGLHSYAN